MPLLGRILRRSVCCLLGVVSGVCAAQTLNQFINQPRVWPTGGRVTSLLTGGFQNPAFGGADILYINAATGSGPTSSVLVGEELNEIQYSNQPRNMITFTGATNVAAALGNFNSIYTTDYAFAISGVSTNNLCVYYGTGARGTTGIGSYDGGNPPNAYPPKGGESGCMTLPTQTTNPSLANPTIFSYIAALPFTTSGLSQLLVEDSANNLLYVIANNGTTGSTLPGFTLIQTIHILLADGPGPIYSGYFDKNGNPYFVINGQTGHSATVYNGNSTGNFAQIANYNVSNFGGHIYSMLLQDMDVPADDIADMVVELDNGVIEIHKGNGDGTFATTREGGTASPNALMGNGGHLAAIDPNSLNILTTTPIGLSVLQNGGSGSLNYTLKGIYNIGPGRSSVARGFFGKASWTWPWTRPRASPSSRAMRTAASRPPLPTPRRPRRWARRSGNSGRAATST